LAQRANFVSNLIRKLGQVDTGVAALEFVLHLGTRKLVQHHLHHGEFVEVGVEEAGDDHGL
jgi:hypothetical protein